MPADDKKPTRLILGIAIVLSLWAIILGIGAAIYPNINKPQPIRFFLVVGCMGLFLALWAGTIHVAKARSLQAGSNANEQPPTSYASVASLILIGLTAIGYGIQAVKLFSFTNAWFTLTLVLTLPVAASAALIGLSDPRPRRGKMLGLLTLLLTTLLGCSLWFRR